jgi:hypothetical protein
MSAFSKFTERNPGTANNVLSALCKWAEANTAGHGRFYALHVRVFGQIRALRYYRIGLDGRRTNSQL